MLLRVQYKNDKYDYVNQQTLNNLINQKLIKEFYRPQEERWVNIDIGPIRKGWGGDRLFYVGMERRQKIQ